MVDQCGHMSAFTVHQSANIYPDFCRCLESLSTVFKKNYPTTINANFYLDIHRNLEYLNPIFIYNFKKLFIATMNANLYLNILINLESFIPILTLATIFNKLL